MRIDASRVLWTVLLVIVALGLVACGGGGGGSGGGNDLLTVRDIQGFPNGKFFTNQPTPTSTNQCIWVEFTAPVDPTTVFDGTTSNGLSSAVRLLSFFYSQPASAVTPASPLTRVRLPGIGVLNGMTNFNPATKTYGSSASRSVTRSELNIPANVPISGNVFLFVADTDGDYDTIESFLPADIRNNVGRLQNSQIMVNFTDGVRSTGGRKLSPEFTDNFVVGATDQIAPTVDSTVPSNGASNVPVGDPIKIRFSEPIDASSVIPAPLGAAVPTILGGVNLQVSAQVIPPGQPVPVAVTVPGTISPTSGQTSEITFTPMANLPGQTLIIVNIYSAASTLIAANTQPPYHPAVTDPSANTLAPNSFTDIQFTFQSGPGPKLANNPIDPEAIHFITSASGMGTVWVNPLERAANGIEDRIQEVDSTGALTQLFPGGLLDGVVGPFAANLLPQLSADPPRQTGNTINNPPRQCQYWLQGFPQRGNPPGASVVLPGKFSPPAIAEISTCVGTVPNPMPPMTPPPNNYCPEELNLGPAFRNVKPGLPYGVYLFVSNEADNVVHCVNSNSFQIVKDLPTPDPRGIGISPDFRFLFVSNFGANRLSVLDVTGGTDGLPKGDLIRLIPVGQGPQGVAVQPNGEDVFVCNRLGRTVSVIGIANLGNPGDPVRVTLQSNDPYEVSAGPRLPTFPYWAYITNPGVGEVTIFESGPLQVNGFGRDQVVNIIANLERPTGITGDQWFNVWQGNNPIPSTDSATGAFIAMNGDGTVQHLKLTRLVTSPFPNPPPSFIEARFEIAQTYRVGDSPRDVCVDNNLQYCNTPDGKQWPYVQTMPPVMQLPSRLYVTNGDGSISVSEIATGRELLRLPPTGASRIFGYYKQ